jgi:hypothetical protein
MMDGPRFGCSYGAAFFSFVHFSYVLRRTFGKGSGFIPSGAPNYSITRLRLCLGMAIDRDLMDLPSLTLLRKRGPGA